MNLLPISIAFRYIIRQNNKSRPSVLSFMAFVGVTLGVSIPLIVMSIFWGFQQEIQEKILGIKGHLTIYSLPGKTISHNDRIIDYLESSPIVTSAVPNIELQGMLKLYDEFRPVILKGVPDKIFKLDKTFSKLYRVVEGHRDLSKANRVHLGHELANNYLIDINKRLQIITANRSFKTSTLPSYFSVQATAFFKTGFLEYDNSMVITSVKTLQKHLKIKDKFLQIDVKLQDPWQAQNLVDKIRAEFVGEYQIYSWQELHQNLFKALALEKIAMWLIVSFILIVAIFNVSSTQIVLVHAKLKEIAILKTMGMSPFSLASIFIVTSSMITLTGGLLACFIARLVSAYLNEILKAVEWIIDGLNRIYFYLINLSNMAHYKEFKLIPEGVYYIDEIPVIYDFSIYLTVFLSALLLSITASLFPALKATRVSPVEIIKGSDN